MAFKFVFNDYGAPERRISHLMATNAEAFIQGEAVILNSSTGRWTKAAAGGPIAGFANQTLAAGTDQFLEVLLAREGDNWDCAYTGTPAATFNPGQNAADIDATGLLVNAADVTGGALAILEVNTVKTTVRVKVKNRQLS